MWTKGSSRCCATPANARRTGKPSPSNPVGALVTDRTGRSREASSVGEATTGSVRGSATVMAGISAYLLESARLNKLYAQVFPLGGSVPAARLGDEAADAQRHER